MCGILRMLRQRYKSEGVAVNDVLKQYSKGHPLLSLSIPLLEIVKMKLAIATLLVGSAAAFAPAATTVRNTALNMAETATETKVRLCHLYLKRRFLFAIANADENTKILYVKKI